MPKPNYYPAAAAVTGETPTDLRVALGEQVIRVFRWYLGMTPSGPYENLDFSSERGMMRFSLTGDKLPAELKGKEIDATTDGVMIKIAEDRLFDEELLPTCKNVMVAGWGLGAFLATKEKGTPVVFAGASYGGTLSVDKYYREHAKATWGADFHDATDAQVSLVLEALKLCDPPPMY